MMGGPLYRVWQLVSALRVAPPDDAALDLARSYLPPRALELFCGMPAADQIHSVTIARQLLAQGHCAAPLIQAALLHDAAKARIGLVYRSVVVALNALDKRALARLASPDPESWRYPFYASLHHPEKGARMAEAVGLDPRAVALIRAHQAPLPAAAEGVELAEWQMALKALDDKN